MALPDDAPPDEAPTPLLTIDLDALAANWRAFAAIAGPAETAAVVKADAYGLGLLPAARRLWREGARTFFVATQGEGAALAAALPGANIYVLNGLLAGDVEGLLRSGLRPVLQSAEAVQRWRDAGGGRPCALQIDTGMMRLGVPDGEIPALAGINLTLVLGHLERHPT